jgi:WD40 repeat protein
MYQALAMTRLVGNDHTDDSPVLFVYPDPEHAEHPVVLRQGDKKDGGFQAPRKGWTVERGAVAPQGQIAYGGTGGFVVVEEPGRNAMPARKLFPFAMTGLGFSTDGQWVALADSSSNMRIQRTADLATDNVVTRKLIQLATGYKLVLFLVTRRFQGEYPVRQWALSVGNDRPGDRDSVRAAALTESGRLLTWEKPGPIGKQLALTDRRTVGDGYEFTAITTHPRTQQVWAATYGALGTLLFGDPPSFQPCSKISRATVSSMAWNAQGTRLALGLRAGDLRVMAPEEGTDCGLREILSLPAHAAAVTSVVWKGDLLATGSIDGSARVWNLTLQKDDEALFQKLRAQQNALSFDELADQVLARLKK